VIFHFRLHHKLALRHQHLSLILHKQNQITVLTCSKGSKGLVSPPKNKRLFTFMKVSQNSI